MSVNKNNHSGMEGARIAIFPGSFDPFTTGHANIVERGLALFDRIIVAVGVSVAKHSDDEIAERLAPIKQLYADNEKVDVISYDCLTVDIARKVGARFILRGVRNVTDFEYERNMADVNRRLAGIETVFLNTIPELATVSSSLVRELRHFGHNASDMIP